MALHHHPRTGSVLVCDFDTGFRPPEIVKVRPVVVVSRFREDRLCTVVPLSTTPPFPVEAWHHQLSRESLPNRYRNDGAWAKCDMLYTVSLERLDRVLDGRDHLGRRLYVARSVTRHDLAAIHSCIRHALGLA